MTLPDSSASADPGETPGGVITRRGTPDRFEVHLDVFSGPFELLLGLISKHKLDITEIALAQVTDEFIALMRARHDADGTDGAGWDLSQASEFVLVAATLLELKAARLLPTPDTEDEEDLALLEARDLLFARLLQYRAYRQVADWVAGRMATEGRRFPRQAGLDPRFADLLPELILGITPDQFALIAARAMVPRTPPAVPVDHLRTPRISVAEQARLVMARLAEHGTLTFAELAADAESTPVVVARFLALLGLFRDAVLSLDQPETFGALRIRWNGSRDDVPEVTDLDAEFDADDLAAAAGGTGEQR